MTWTTLRACGLPLALLLSSGGFARAQPQTSDKKPLLPAADAEAPRPADQRYAQSAASALGASAQGLRAFRVRARKRGKPYSDVIPGFRAIRFRVSLPQGPLVVIRMRAKTPKVALNLLERQLNPQSKERMILDQRQRDLVILVGEKALRDPKQAGVYLRALWQGGNPLRVKRATIAVIPATKGKAENFSAYTRVNGGFYQAAANMFRQTRANEGKRIRNMSFRFLDAPRNELDVAYSGAMAFHMHALVSPDATMSVVMQPDRARARAEWAYLMELLKERKTPPKRSPGMIDVLKRAGAK